MKKIFKRIFFIGLVLFLLIQFYQPTHNTDNGQVSALHFTKMYNVPDSVSNILKASCYDCHSNNTNYRWYDYIQPARMLVESHIKNAKQELNFSEWGNYTSRKQQNKLDRIVKQLKANEMPLPSYTLLHKSAKLNDVQKETIINWINTLQKNNE